MASKTKTFTFPEEILEKLAVYSKESMVPQSALISKLLKEFFEKHEQKTKN